MYIQHIGRMNEPVTAMSEVRRHLADTIDRARHDHTPTFMTQRGRTTPVLLDADDYRRLLEAEHVAEDAWLNRLADEAEEEGRNGAVSLEEMARELAQGEE
ncbi:type II toxin-antitoxin system Phd/YefM family antitoxin [Nocardiopsis sp. NRRL B-16309]|uniref:type II toxin-antitoxin system Phd/YefM family antitoxin n=1 Tax=Nocardiopsis sp. NRRL B-16309 TaxID=1519494 RepID=UPI0006AF4C97|nr:type II toxin-antitoxin system Phd/YefM family antitoxin [Nocardiopsis sp. NRRL B-16309]KOX17109.1 antitoxin [Nocardiopsis sp. NRRL B-16309]